MRNIPYIEYILLFSIGLLMQLGVTIYKKNLKKNLLGKFSREATGETSDQYVEYYQKAQKIDFFVVVGWVVVLCSILYTANSGFLTGLAIGVGAIIITFSSFIVSLIYYFYLISEFRVGQTIRIGEKWQGEIISIKPLYIGLSGKNDNGEHTGEFFLVPNKLVRENTIIKVDLKKNAIKKVLLDLPFDSNTWDISYDEMLTALEEFLQKLLATNTPTTVGFYKSYIGWKYKLDVLYKDSGSIILQLGFIDTLNNQRKTKQKIVAFMESLKKKEELVNIH